MNPKLQNLCALVAGALLGAGLVVSGMTQPTKVIGFLDVFGAWDASLLFVMGGAIAIHSLAYPIARRRSTPLFAPTMLIPTRRDIDAKLVGGAAIFGIGWGLGGFCPGPSIVALASGSLGSLTFVATMLLGLFVGSLLEKRA